MSPVLDGNLSLVIVLAVVALSFLTIGSITIIALQRRPVRADFEVVGSTVNGVNLRGKIAIGDEVDRSVSEDGPHTVESHQSDTPSMQPVIPPVALPAPAEPPLLSGPESRKRPRAAPRASPGTKRSPK